MSRLLFVLVMKLLTRVLRRMSALHNFQFHSMCKATKLTHLIFAHFFFLGMNIKGCEDWNLASIEKVL